MLTSRSARSLLALATLLWFAALAPLLPRSALSLHQAAAVLGAVAPGLLWSALLLAAAWGPGELLLRRSGATARSPGSSLVSLALGIALLQCAAMLLGLTGLLGPIPATAVLLAGLIAGATALRHPTGGSPHQLGATDGAVLVAVGALVLPTLWVSAAPPLGPDELQYHLRLVRTLVATGGFATPGPEDLLAGHLQGLHALTAMLATLGGVEVTRPLALALGLAGLATAAPLAATVGGPAAARAALLVVVGSVSALAAAPTFNTDLTASLPLGGLTLLALQHLKGERPLPWLAMGLLAGAAVTVKITAAIVLLPIAASVLLITPAPRGPTIRALGLAVAVAVGLWLPWGLRNTLLAGHPLFPVGGRTIPPLHPEAFVFNTTSRYGPGGGLPGFVRAPWDLFVLGREFDYRHYAGRLNIWPLVATPALGALALRSRRGAVLVLTSLGAFALWAGPLRRVVYLLPAWPLLAAATGAALDGAAHAAGRRRHAARAALLLALGLSALFETAPALLRSGDALRLAAGTLSPQEFEDRHLEGAVVIRWVRRYVPQDETVMVVWGWQQDALQHRTILEGAGLQAPLRLALAPLADVDELRRWLAYREVRWVFRRLRPLQAEDYPELSEQAFRYAYLHPQQLVDELLADHGRRWEAAGGWEIWALDGAARK